MALVPLVALPFGTPVAQHADTQTGGLTASVTIGQRLEYENHVGGTNVNDEGFGTITDLGLVVHLSLIHISEPTRPY